MIRAAPGSAASNATPVVLVMAPFLSVFTLPVEYLPLLAIHCISRSSAVTGTPSDHFAALLIVYLTVKGLFEVTTQVMNESLFTTLSFLS